MCEPDHRLRKSDLVEFSVARSLKEVGNWPLTKSHHKGSKDIANE